MAGGRLLRPAERIGTLKSAETGDAALRFALGGGAAEIGGRGAGGAPLAPVAAQREWEEMVRMTQGKGKSLG